MQLTIFDKHEYVDLQNFRSDAQRIIDSTNHPFVLKESEVVIKIVNDYSIWFYDSTEGINPMVYNWSTRSLKSQAQFELSKFISNVL